MTSLWLDRSRTIETDTFSALVAASAELTLGR